MAIRWDKFTVKAQEAIQQANDLASQHGNPELLPVHVLASLLEDREGIVVSVLSKLGVNPANVLVDTMKSIEKLPKVSGAGTQAHLSVTMQRVIDRGFKEADKFKDEYVSTEHLLLALASEKDRNNEAYQALKAGGATYEAI